MAISNEEKEILNRFIKENKELFDLVIEYAEVSDDVKEQLKSGMDTTEYLFNGKKLRKTHLFSELVKRYIDDKQPKTFSDIEKVFGTIGKRKGLVREKGNIKDEKRFDFVKMGNIEFGASNQWSIGDMDSVLEFAKSKLGYSIEIA